MELGEDKFIAGFHRKVQKVWKKAWHEKHIKRKEIQLGNLVILDDSKILKNPWIFQMDWLGPQKIEYIIEIGVVK